MNEITAAEYKALKKGRPRFNRSKPEDRTVEGHVFDSKAEASRYRQLRIKQRAGRIRWIVIQPGFLLAGVVYKADFMYEEERAKGIWGRVVEEVKPLIQDPKARADMLRPWRRNAAQVKEIHGIDVVLVER